MIREYSSTFSLDNEVLFVLMMHKGQNNPINRWTLVRKIYGEEAVSEETENDKNLYDRSVRSSINRLRKAGEFICSKSNGKGYYYATSREEYKDFVRSYLGNDYDKFENVRAMDAKADLVWGPEPKPTPIGQAAMFT
jgi:hypothetical protein